MSQEKKAVSIRVNKSLMKDIQQVEEETGMSQSDVVRSLIREGVASREKNKEVEQLADRLERTEDRLQEIERKRQRPTVVKVLDRILR